MALLLAACAPAAATTTTLPATTVSLTTTTAALAPTTTTTTRPTTTTTTRPTTTTTTQPTTTTEPVLQFSEGVYIVGEEIPPGIYRFAGYFARLDQDQEIIDNEIFDVEDGWGAMTVLESDAYVEISHVAVALEDTRPLNPITEGFTEGTYLIGLDLPAGRYRVTPESADSSAYWARLDEDGEIIDNDIADGQLIVVVRESDWALTINGAIEEA
jgi:hypothetical protein